MNSTAIIGAGASGMFCAANLDGGAEVFDAQPAPMKKLLLTGGGRCNFTNLNIDGGDLRLFYPRGANNLRKCFGRFSAKDAAEFFRRLGVPSKEEDAGRLFPVSDKSSDIADALLSEALRRGCKIHTSKPVAALERCDGGFRLSFADSSVGEFKNVVVAVGGTWGGALRRTLENMGHSFAESLPSLFALKTREADRKFFKSGVSVPDAVVSAKFGKAEISGRGALLFTHFGISGPAVLKFSSFAARELAKCGYSLPVKINFLPDLSPEDILAAFVAARRSEAKKFLKNYCPFDIPAALWLPILDISGVPWNGVYAELSRAQSAEIARNLHSFECGVLDRAAAGSEFVMCGGLECKNVDFSTMQSRRVAGLFFLGECLDIDGITGGFNLQAAWSTAKVCADFINSEK